LWVEEVGEKEVTIFGHTTAISVRGDLDMQNFNFALNLPKWVNYSFRFYIVRRNLLTGNFFIFKGQYFFCFPLHSSALTMTPLVL